MEGVEVWKLRINEWTRPFIPRGDKMRKICCIIIGILLLTTISFGEILGADGGVKDDYTYQEVLFITGKPILVEGTLDIRGNTYTYTLENTKEKVKVTRRLTFARDVEDKLDRNQRFITTSLDRFNERIVVGSDRYNLEDFQYSKSIVYDCCPAVDFYSGNMEGKKIYSINGKQGQVCVDMHSDTLVGYEHKWGASETHIVQQKIHSERKTGGEEDEKEVEWDGMVTLKFSSTDRKDITYIENKPTEISFRGGFLQTEKQENILQYTYDMPNVKEEGSPADRKRIKGKGDLHMDSVPINQRLVLPNLKDISGHWAEESIDRLYSLEVFDEASPFFGPKLPMTRAAFAKAMVKAITITEEDIRKPRRSRKEPEEISPFKDVEVKDVCYPYIKKVNEKGIMQGISPEAFMPDGILTRAQAITIMIRALGLEGRAPSPPYRTGFIDDEAIPYWAKDAIYVAHEIGLVRGDSNGYVEPNQTMSKAEAATFIDRFLQHIREEITVDYRERIINHY
jgi:hypothetical protein